jgi:hypothetical protein
MSVLNKKQLTQRMSGLDKFDYINKQKIELNNLLITLEQILSKYLNTYITFIVESKITDPRSFRRRSISVLYNIFIQFVFL